MGLTSSRWLRFNQSMSDWIKGSCSEVFCSGRLVSHISSVLGMGSHVWGLANRGSPRRSVTRWVAHSPRRVHSLALPKTYSFRPAGICATPGPSN
jgi:hypothetical protein